jgi:hypothetical protein
VGCCVDASLPPQVAESPGRWTLSSTGWPVNANVRSASGHPTPIIHIDTYGHCSAQRRYGAVDIPGQKSLLPPYHFQQTEGMVPK